MTNLLPLLVLSSVLTTNNSFVPPALYSNKYLNDPPKPESIVIRTTEFGYCKGTNKIIVGRTDILEGKFVQGTNWTYIQINK